MNPGVKTNIYFAYFLIMILTAGCKEKKLTADEYIEWMENPENGLKITRIIGDIEFILQYKPIDYILAKEQMQKKMTKEEKEKRMMELGEMQYYHLTYSLKEGNADILKYNLTGDSEYQERVYYFSFGHQENIHLAEGRDTLPCELFHFERYYGLSPKMSFSLGFKKTSKADDKQLMILDEVYGSGPVKFTISSADIENIPAIIN